MDSTADRLGTGQLCRAPDRASSTASGLRGTGISTDFIRNVPRSDRIRAGRAAGTLSNTGVGDQYISRRRVLLASYPSGRLRSDRVSWIAVVAGGDKLSLTFGSCRAQRDGLKLARTRAAGQCKRCSQDQSEKRKREPKLCHNPSRGWGPRAQKVKRRVQNSAHSLVIIWDAFYRIRRPKISDKRTNRALARAAMCHLWRLGALRPSCSAPAQMCKLMQSTSTFEGNRPIWLPKWWYLHENDIKYNIFM